jgi:muscleblind protein
MKVNKAVKLSLDSFPTLNLQIFPGLLPYKRPAPDKQPGGLVYHHQPTAAAYQQLIQLQSAQQSYVPVSCEYTRHSSSDHASANNTVYPLNTSTATSNANNLHHHPNLLYSQTSINACTINPNNNYQLTIPSNNNNNNYELRKLHENNHNNHHHHLNTTNPTNSNNFINSHLNMNNYYLENHASNKNNNPITSTFFADADAQINTTQPTAHQNSINQYSPSKAIISSTIIDNNMLSKNAAVSNANATSSSDHDGGDASENALTVQNAKSLNVANGHDVSSSCMPSNVEQTLIEESNKNKSINDMPNGTDLATNNNSNSGQVDSALTTSTTTSSVQSAIDESNLNAISFNSATSSSPAASMSAIYTTSSITINNNNSILSRKNSLTTPNQQLINSSSNISGLKAPSSIANSKVDSVPDYINASSLNNPAQAALFSAVLSPYQQFALTPNLYSDPAQLAKEMAQKNYANALKYAVAQNSQAAGKATSQLNALSPYSTVAFSAGNNTAAMLQPGTSTTTPRLPAPMNPSTRAAYYPAAALSRPIQNQFQQFIRPQMPINPLSASAAAAAAQNQVNQYYAAAAAQQQFLNQQNFFYPGLTSPLASPHMAVTSGTSTPTHSPFVSTSSSYHPFAYGQAPGMQATHMMQVPQITSQPSQTGSTSAVVLNPYKKMKTS